MNENCLLNLVVSPQAESAVTDWLLARDDIPGFSTLAIAGHGSSEHAMTLAEQVAGKRRQVMFKLLLPCADANRVLEAIQRQFAGSGMHYWLQPVIASGHLD